MRASAGRLRRIIASFPIRPLMALHNLSYSYISLFAAAAEGGIHPKHRLMEYHRFFIDNIAAGETVLDIGCGNGSLTYDMAAKAKHVTAIDIDKNNIETARRRFSRDNIEYLHDDVMRYDFGSRFNAIVLSNVLEHVSDRKRLLFSMRDKAGRFLIRVPMVNRDWLTYYKKEQGIEYRLDASHQIEYTLESFTGELAEAGLKIEKASVQFGEIWAVAVSAT